MSDGGNLREIGVTGRDDTDLSRRLTPRQYEVLGLVAQRFSSKEIGRELGLSPKTVDRHVEEMLVRLAVGSRSEAGRLFLDHKNGRGEQFPMGIPNVDPVASDPPKTSQPAEVSHEDSQQAGHTVWFAAILKRLITLPPVGGRKHEMTWSERLVTIGHIGLFALLVVAAMLTLITGILHLLDR